MASHLDLEEQEQLDQLKAFWKRWGNLITWGLTLALAAFAGWNAWNWYQRDQAVKAGAMFDELDRAAQSGDADKAGRVFADLKERYPRTSYAAQAALQAAKVQFDKGQLDAAQASLNWAAENAQDDSYRDVARLRLAGLLMDGKKFDDAAKVLDAIKSPDFVALQADRRGDLFKLQGKPEQAKAEYKKAFADMDKTQDYRHLVEAKLAALGVNTAEDAASAPAGAGK
ncbi:YfgM family protein [Roseateles koreensis]|uniref:Ancillary SecYEG translocon subunit n=1 Tax=Roseateles koreensis TaxID=2987526 RepID=A0ABT5KL54_9BURK|nr:tetratricopeptide repeat protein [Roseateles koreensis]MDC8783660.1 tetratricopeptide repeat protein [Roseateles koreensis]